MSNFKKKSFLDIGSGKGGVITYAYELGCNSCEGIEYEYKLNQIAEKNIDILKYNDHVKSNNIDARLFERYADFNIYFLFNPFHKDVYNDVIYKIIEANKSSNKSDKYLITYGGENGDAITSSGAFKLFIQGECPYRRCLFNIYQFV